MNKRVLLNVILVVVLVSIGGAAFAAVRSSSSSSATTQTTATAKRGTVLESVTSTGNVEAPTSLSLSFQQSGQVTAIYVKTGEHVIAGQKLAKVDDTQQSHALASAKASQASAQAALAALHRGETSPERASDAASVASASQSVASAEQNVAHSQQTQLANAAKYQQSVESGPVVGHERQRRRFDRAIESQPGEQRAALVAELSATRATRAARAPPRC